MTQSYHGRSFNGIRRQSRFSYPALCVYPLARIMRIYLERGNAGELYSNSF